MAIIYIVTSGSYSDYSIGGVFSTREKADHYLGEANLDEPRIEEWTLDDDANKIKRPLYLATIDLNSGEILETGLESSLADPNQRTLDSSILDFSDRRGGVAALYAGRMIGKVASFESADHSLKLAAELRQKYLRERSP